MEGETLKTKVAGLLLTVFLSGAFCQVSAQQPVKPLPRIGFIVSSGKVDAPSLLLDSFRQGLRDLGYVEDKNIVIERKYAEGRLDKMPSLVQELVDQKVDVIIGVNNVVIRAAKETTKNIPVVMISSVDPVKAGYVQSFAHPGGNVTGLAWLARELGAKRLELLREMFPRVTRVAIFWDADAPGPKVAFKEYTAAAPAFKFDLKSIEVRGPNSDFEGAFRAIIAARSEALIIVSNPLVSQHMKTIFDLATKHKLPTMNEEDRYVVAGGLVSYGAGLPYLFRRAAEHVVDILKGHNPADLPVKLATKFEIFVNLKTAKQIGVTIPQHVLVQADKVIK